MTHIYICLQIAFSSVCPFLKLLCLSFVEICMIAFIVVVQSLRHVWLFATSCTAARQSSPSLTTSRSLLKFMSIELEPSHPQWSLFPLALCLSQHQDLFQWVSSLHQVAKELDLQFQHQSFPWIFRVDFIYEWFDLLAVQGILKNFLQHYSSKASILQCSAFFMVQLPHLYMTPGKTIALTIWTVVDKVMSLLFNIWT